MDEIEAQGPRISIGGLILNLLTLLVFAAILGVVGLFGMLFLNPYLPFNPFPPPTLPATLGYPTATNTPANFLPPTWTATITGTALPTETSTPTPPPTETQTPTPPTGTVIPYSFIVRAPIYMENSFINDDGCNWMGVGGQVFDLDDEGIPGQRVLMGGQLGSQPVDLTVLTGSADVLGPSGYVFNLSDSPIASDGTMWVQLVDEAGLPQSDRLYLTTYASCEQNFVLVNWNQVE